MFTYLSYFPFQKILLIAIFFWITYIVFWGKENYKEFILNFKRLIISGITMIYTMYFIYIYLMPRSFGATHEPYILFQLVPFKTISSINFINIIGHILIIMLMPLLIYAITNSIRKARVYSIAITVMIEPLQMFIDWCSRFPHFVIDIDDFILQMMGCVLGMILVVMYRQLFQKN